MPEGVDGWGRAVVAGSGSGLADILVAEGGAETANDQARDTGNDREGDALLQGVGVGHWMSLPFAVKARGGSDVSGFRYRLSGIGYQVEARNYLWPVELCS